MQGSQTITSDDADEASFAALSPLSSPREEYTPPTPSPVASGTSTPISTSRTPTESTFFGVMAALSALRITDEQPATETGSAVLSSKLPPVTPITETQSQQNSSLNIRRGRAQKRRFDSDDTTENTALDISSKGDVAKRPRTMRHQQLSQLWPVNTAPNQQPSLAAVSGTFVESNFEL